MPDDPTPDHPGPGHPSLERLRAHLEDRLPAEDARRVADHLDHCDRCVGALDELEAPPAPLRPADDGPPMLDEDRLRRSIRRTLLRTAFNAAMLLLLGAIALPLLGALIVHPVFVERGDRVSESVIASIDLPMLTVPGAEVREVLSNIGPLRRTTTVTVERAVGGQMSRLGSYTTRLGPLGMSTPGGASVFGDGPRLSEQPVDSSPIAFRPDRLGEGTAVTVQLFWDDGRSRDAADRVVEAADELALLWVGFRVPGGEPEDPRWQLGYGACHEIPQFLREVDSGGFGSNGAARVLPPGEGGGADHALEEVRRATTGLAATGWLDDEPVRGGVLDDLGAAATWFADNDPEVASVVITGPTAAVAAAVEANAADRATLLEVDFDRGPPQPCG